MRSLYKYFIYLNSSVLLSALFGNCGPSMSMGMLKNKVGNIDNLQDNNTNNSTTTNNNTTTNNTNNNTNTNNNNNPSCSNCNKRLINKKRCSRCKSTYYCNKECQTQHWNNGHKTTCKSISDSKNKKSNSNNISQIGDVDEKLENLSSEDLYSKIRDDYEKLFFSYIKAIKENPDSLKKPCHIQILKKLVEHSLALKFFIKAASLSYFLIDIGADKDSFYLSILACITNYYTGYYCYFDTMSLGEIGRNAGGIDRNDSRDARYKNNKNRYNEYLCSFGITDFNKITSLIAKAKNDDIKAVIHKSYGFLQRFFYRNDICAMCIGCDLNSSCNCDLPITLEKSCLYKDYILDRAWLQNGLFL